LSPSFFHEGHEKPKTVKRGESSIKADLKKWQRVVGTESAKEYINALTPRFDETRGAEMERLDEGTLFNRKRWWFVTSGTLKLLDHPWVHQ